MESEFNMLLITAGLSLFTRLFMCVYSESKKRKIALKVRQKSGWVSCIIMPKSSGKSKLTESLSGTSSSGADYLIIDLESVLKDTADYHQNINNKMVVYYPKCKEYLQRVKQNFPKRRLLVITTEPDLADYLEITDTVVYSPTLAYHDTLAKQITDGEKRKDASYSYSRCISSKRPCNYYECQEDLVREVKARYGLRLSL